MKIKSTLSGFFCNMPGKKESRFKVTDKHHQKQNYQIGVNKITGKKMIVTKTGGLLKPTQYSYFLNVI